MCNHAERFTLYRRGPKAAGSKFLPWGQVCAKCAKTFPKEADREESQ